MPLVALIAAWGLFAAQEWYQWAIHGSSRREDNYVKHEGGHSGDHLQGGDHDRAVNGVEHPYSVRMVWQDRLRE